MLIEVKGAKVWLDTIKKHYDISKTTLRDSEEAFTIILSIPNKTLLVGRYCRVNKYGVVMCRRKSIVDVGYDRRGAR